MPSQSSPERPAADTRPVAERERASRLVFRGPLERLPPYSAGRSVRDALRERQGGGPLVALAANEGPYGPFPDALRALQDHFATINRYPESGFRTLRERLSAHLSLPVERIAVAAGGIAIIHHLSLALLDPGDEILQCSPTFHCYGLDARKLGATTVSVPVKADGSYDLAAMLERIGPSTRLVYVCNPNNPTGGIVRREELLAFVQAVPPDVAILIDEAYFEYVDDPGFPDTARDPAFHRQNLITLRTFSKAYGLAGLRVAYAVGAPAIVEVIAKVQSNYEVTSLSQAAAIASLDDHAELARRRALNRAGRETLTSALVQSGYEPFPSQANFVCVRVGAAKAVARALEERGVIVRPLDAMGDPTSIRITIGTPEETRKAIDAMTEVARLGMMPGRG